jgi:hypothetical protein
MKRVAVLLTVAFGLGLPIAGASHDGFAQRATPPEHRGLIDPRPTSDGRLLIDASRDGGLWWFPQGELLDARKFYQGKALADYLRRRPIPVDELSRGVTVTPDVLSRYNAVIRAGVCGPAVDSTVKTGGYAIGNRGGACFPYAEAEIAAYRRFVESGGRLLLLSSFIGPGRDDGLASSFGLRVGGISEGERRVNRFTPHPVTLKVKNIFPYIGSGILDAPSDFTILAFASKGTFQDLNVNHQPDRGEPVGVGVWGVMNIGRGVLLFVGDTRTLELVPQPLTDKVISFLTSKTP